MTRTGNEVVRKVVEDIEIAERRLQKTLEAEFPKGRTVRVTHPRGEFLGTIECVSGFYRAVWVTNNTSGKSRKWHYSTVKVEGNAGEVGA